MLRVPNCASADPGGRECGRQGTARKKSLKDIDFSRTVSLRPGASDFLSDDSWKEDFIGGRIKL